MTRRGKRRWRRETGDMKTRERRRRKQIRNRCSKSNREREAGARDDPINTRVYRAVMPVAAAYLLDTHLNLDQSRPGEPREKPHTSSRPDCRLPSRKRVDAQRTPGVAIERPQRGAYEGSVYFTWLKFCMELPYTTYNNVSNTGTSVFKVLRES